MKIARLFDVDRGTAERLQSGSAPEAEIHAELESLLDKGDIDAAIVCSPTSSHFHQVRACRERGVPVLCEKPLADTRESIEELVERAANGAPTLSVAYQRRYWST